MSQKWQGAEIKKYILQIILPSELDGQGSVEEAQDSHKSKDSSPELLELQQQGFHLLYCTNHLSKNCTTEYFCLEEEYQLF